MAVRIRMKMMGRKHRHFFRICVMDSTQHRDGLPIEEIGTYDPKVNDKAKRVQIQLDRYDHWIKVGALPSEHVRALVRRVRANRFGEAKPAPALVAPKPLVEAEVAAPATEEQPAEA